MRNIPLKIKNSIYLGILLLIISASILLLSERDGFTINVPLTYKGGDDASYASEIKLMKDGNTWLSSDKIGMPYGTDRTAEASYYLFDDVHFISYVLVKITGNVIWAYNLTFFALLYFNAIAAYMVFISRNIHPYIACMGAWIYGFSPYVFMRKEGHLMLAAIYCIPLAFLLALWIYEDDHYLEINRNVWKYKRNWISIIICLLIVMNGIGYYPFYSCMVIMLAGLSKALKTKKMRGIWQAFKQCVEIVTMYIIILIPFVIACLKKGEFSTGGERSFTDIEQFSLRIARLFISNVGTGISFIDKKITEYYSVMVYPTEMTEYLGLFAIVGFVILLLILFLNVGSELRLLSEINVALLLYGTLGGFSVFIYMFLTQAVRCTNRLSVYIAFISIYTLCMVASRAIEKGGKGMPKRRKLLMLGVFSVFTMISMMDQFRIDSLNNKIYSAEYTSDKNIVKKLESLVPSNSMIYQLPYNPYPTSGMVNEMYPDQLLNAYICSDNLKWSYGARYGEISDEWCRNVSQMGTEEMIEALREKGFSAIYIDKRGYQTAELSSLLESIDNVIQNESIVSENGNIICYIL